MQFLIRVPHPGVHYCVCFIYTNNSILLVYTEKGLEKKKTKEKKEIVCFFGLLCFCFVWLFVLLETFCLSSVALELSGLSFPFRSFVNVTSGGIDHGRRRRSNGWYGNRGGFEAFVGESRLQGAEAEGRRRRHEDSRC